MQVLAAAGELERGLIRSRTRAAMAELKAKGVKLGRPVKLSSATQNRVVELHREGLSLRKIVDRLNSDGIPTATDRQWHASTVRQVLQRAA